VINVTKDRVWSRMALRPESAAMSMPPLRDVFPEGQIPDEIQIPKPRLPREEQQDAYLRERELDPNVYFPPDVNRELVQHYSEDTFKLDVKAIIAAQEHTD